ncbi:MAG TPA: tetratricopeptide repeat protein [Spirochaetota bacterium]|nr:tetratricopeptide repeat protein [Spirochaetota bacterium]
MKTFRFMAVILLIFSFAVISSAEENSGLANLKKVADDMKFQNGMEFYKLEKFDRALNEFNEYIEIYFDGIHRNEALKKIAEIHIRFFDYQKAIEAYRTLYQEYSSTDEGIDAYFQIGICYKKMGFDSKAEAIFKYIVDEHPGTTAAYNSEIQLDLLKISADQK